LCKEKDRRTEGQPGKELSWPFTYSDHWLSPHGASSSTVADGGQLMTKGALARRPWHLVDLDPFPPPPAFLPPGRVWIFYPAPLAHFLFVIIIEGRRPGQGHSSCSDRRCGNSSLDLLLSPPILETRSTLLVFLGFCGAPCIL
jgi:hypothetical protein